MANKTKLTIDDLEAALDHEDYAGFGYIGERGRVGRIALIQVVDAVVLERASGLGWSAAALQDWAISKAGRWFADETFGSGLSGLALRAIAVKAAATYLQS